MVISIDSSDEDEEETSLPCSQQSTVVSSELTTTATTPSTSSSSSSSRKMTATTRKERDRLAASGAAPSSAQVDVHLLPPMPAQSMPYSSLTPTSPLPTRTINEALVRHSLSDISNISSPVDRERFLALRAFYTSVRARFGHPDNSALCVYCGVREHTFLHHEADFSRLGTNIRAPSNMRPNELKAEIRRCTRKDGSIGLVSLCSTCHFEAHRQHRPKFRRVSTRTRQRRIAKQARAVRNRTVDNAAKLQISECECDARCGRVVTQDNVTEFEWDHRVQSFDDPEYIGMARLIQGGVSLARCEKERKKCRLLYRKCHELHSAWQQQQRRIEKRKGDELQKRI